MRRIGFGWTASAWMRLAWVAIYAGLVVLAVHAVESMSVQPGERLAAVSDGRTERIELDLNSTAAIREWKVSIPSTGNQTKDIKTLHSDKHTWRGELTGEVSELFIEALGADESATDPRAVKLQLTVDGQAREKIFWSAGDLILRIDLNEWRRGGR